MNDNQPKETSIPTPPDATKPNAVQLLSDFLQEKGLELRLTPPKVRQVDGGGMLVEQPSIVVDYRSTNSIKKN